MVIVKSNYEKASILMDIGIVKYHFEIDSQKNSKILINKVN